MGNISPIKSMMRKEDLLLYHMFLPTGIKEEGIEPIEIRPTPRVSSPQP